jgi:hypothetical protein
MWNATHICYLQKGSLRQEVWNRKALRQRLHNIVRHLM